MTIQKICIVGPGAIGGMMAVKLISAGYDVSALVRTSRVDAMNRDGITLHDEGETFHHTPLAAANAADIGPQDLVIITVKETGLSDVAPAISNLCGPKTQVVQVMNGIPWWFFMDREGPYSGTCLESVDPKGCVSEHFEVERHIGAVINCGVSWREDGSLSHDHSNQLFLGRPSGALGGVEAVADVFRASGYNAEATSNIQQQVMTKLLANMSFNPLSALSMGTTDLLIGDDYVAETLAGLMNEGRAIIKALGLDPGPDPIETLKRGQRLNASKTSMLQDVEAGKPLELEGILGSAIEVASLVKVPVPLLRTVYGLLRVRQQTMQAASS